MPADTDGDAEGRVRHNPLGLALLANRRPSPSGCVDSEVLVHERRLFAAGIPNSERAVRVANDRLTGGVVRLPGVCGIGLEHRVMSVPEPVQPIDAGRQANRRCVGTGTLVAAVPQQVDPVGFEYGGVEQPRLFPTCFWFQDRLGMNFPLPTVEAGRSA